MKLDGVRVYFTALLTCVWLLGTQRVVFGGVATSQEVHDTIYPVATWEGLRLGFEGAIQTRRHARLDGFLEVLKEEDGLTEFVLWETREAKAFHMRNRFVLLCPELSSLILDAKRQLEQQLKDYSEIDGRFVTISGTLEIGDVNWNWLGKFTELESIVFNEFLHYPKQSFCIQIGSSAYEINHAEHQQRATTSTDPRAENELEK